MVIVPKYLLKVPFCNDWVEYKGEVFFAMIDFEKSLKCHRPIIDLCYCATAGLINGRVLKTVNYQAEHFKPSAKLSNWKTSTT
jgi:hypothetical protein